LAVHPDVHFIDANRPELGCWRYFVRSFRGSLQRSPGGHQAYLSCCLTRHRPVAVTTEVCPDQLVLDIAPKAPEARQTGQLESYGASALTADQLRYSEPYGTMLRER